MENLKQAKFKHSMCSFSLHFFFFFFRHPFYGNIKINDHIEGLLRKIILRDLRDVLEASREFIVCLL